MQDKKEWEIYHKVCAESIRQKACDAWDVYRKFQNARMNEVSKHFGKDSPERDEWLKLFGERKS